MALVHIATLLALVMVFCGCAVRRTTPNTYRLVRQNTAPILVPPGVKDATVTERSFRFHTSVRPVRACSIAEHGIMMRPQRHGLRVTVRKQTAHEQPRGWLSTWAASIEERGCVGPGQGSRLATEIADALPRDLAATEGLLRPELRAGYVDLGPEHRLKVVAPILRDASGPVLETPKVSGDDRSLTLDVKRSFNFLGYETSWYAVAERADAKGYRIIPESAEARIGDQVTRSETPRVNLFTLDPDAAWFRLFFLTRRSHSDHDIVILGGRTRAELEERARRFEQDAGSCIKTPGGMCAAMPRAVAVSPHLIAIVNGREVRVPVETRLAQAIQAAGEKTPQRVTPTLVVRRPYAGGLVPVEFDRAKEDILSLPLRGGEDIRW